MNVLGWIDVIRLRQPAMFFKKLDRTLDAGSDRRGAHSQAPDLFDSATVAVAQARLEEIGYDIDADSF